MVYFTGSYPQRALLKARRSPIQSVASFPGYANLEEALSAVSDALACNPWLETIPLPIEQMLPPIQRDGLASHDPR